MTKELSQELSLRLIDFCRDLEAVTEDVKWGNDLVFSVGGKMFAVFAMPTGIPFSFKVEPLVFEGLTAHADIDPAPYLARYSWVAVGDARALPEATLRDLIASSHEIVARRLTKKMRQSLGLTFD